LLALSVVLALAVAGLAACGSSEEPAASPAPSEAAGPDLMTAVDDYMAAWNAHDPAKAASYLALEAVYIDATVGTPVEGREAAQADVIAAFINAAPDCVWERKGEAVVGDHAVAYEWTFSGTNTGAWADGTEATGKEFEFSGLTLMRFNERGEIVYQADYYDALNFFKQLGWAAIFWAKAA
jgi:steroid delta-isomerase-like uncharacterized protein